MAGTKVSKTQSMVFNVALWSWVMANAKIRIAIQSAAVIMAQIQMPEKRAACSLCAPHSKRPATKLRHHVGYSSAMASATGILTLLQKVKINKNPSQTKENIRACGGIDAITSWPPKSIALL
jgi:hypothetical protein